MFTGVAAVAERAHHGPLEAGFRQSAFNISRISGTGHTLSFRQNETSNRQGVGAMAVIPALNGAKRAKLPQALSVGEETFALQMKARGLNFRREYEFCPGRKFRFDFAFLNVAKLGGASLAVEVEGGAHSRGRHTRASGFSSDIEKYNLAALMGWVLLRYTTAMVKSGLADRQVAKLLGVV
jgi:hypothetical protein